MYKSTKLVYNLHHKKQALQFTIEDILLTSELEIKILSYPAQEILTKELIALNEVERIKYDSFSSEKRKLEFFFTRILWAKFGKNEFITYNKLGKPCLTNGYIGISHSKNKIAVGFSKHYPVGIDIEHYSPKIHRIKHKFLSDQELIRYDLEDQNTITTLWSIKEALYKFRSEDGLSFRDDMDIIKIGDENLAELNFNNSKIQVPFHKQCFKNFILTYCIKEI